MRPQPKPKPEFGLWLLGAVLIGLGCVGLAYLLYLFVSVVYLGGSSACPQNLCQ